jgi:hypothetical protein
MELGQPIDHDGRRYLAQLRSALTKNDAIVLVLTPAEFVSFFLEIRSAGKSPTDVEKAYQEHAVKWGLGHAWSRLRPGAKLAANYTATVADVLLLRKLALELGSMFAQYRIRDYRGKTYVVLKGAAGLRTRLKGSRYLASNPKIVEIGLGRLGAQRSIASGVRISVVLSLGFNALDALLTDQTTWHDFIGRSATDLVKVAAAGLAASAGAAMATAGVGLSAFALGPIFVAIVFGVGMTLALDWLDERAGITRALIDAIKECEKAVRDQTYHIRREWNWWHRTEQSRIEFWMRALGAWR